MNIICNVPCNGPSVVQLVSLGVLEGDNLYAFIIKQLGILFPDHTFGWIAFCEYESGKRPELLHFMSMSYDECVKRAKRLS
jgi:hypothetical protein